MYEIDPEHNVATLLILDNDRFEQVVLGLEVKDGSASEPGLATVVDDGVVVIKRIGGSPQVGVVFQFFPRQRRHCRLRATSMDHVAERV